LILIGLGVTMGIAAIGGDKPSRKTDSQDDKTDSQNADVVN